MEARISVVMLVHLSQYAWFQDAFFQCSCDIFLGLGGGTAERRREVETDLDEHRGGVVVVGPVVGPTRPLRRGCKRRVVLALDDGIGVCRSATLLAEENRHVISEDTS